jgi:hypothetical protein
MRKLALFAGAFALGIFLAQYLPARRGSPSPRRAFLLRPFWPWLCRHRGAGGA